MVDHTTSHRQRKIGLWSACLQRPCCVSAHFLVLFQPFFFHGDLRIHLLDQVCQQPLTFLSGLGVHIAGVFFAVWPDGGVPSFPQMVVDLADTAGAWLAPLTLVGLKGAGDGFAGRSVGGGEVCLPTP